MKSTKLLRGELRADEPMARHSSWRVGGPARHFYIPADVADLSDYLQQLPAQEPLLWVGLGSNLLVRDGGWPGSVIVTHKVLGELVRRGPNQVFAGAGVACARLARQCVRWRLGPAEFFAGIPGTVGGALAMNAGAFGGETWAHVDSVEVINRQGRTCTRDRAEYEVGYRKVVPPAEEWFLGAQLHFASDPDADLDNIRRLLARRKESQPIGLSSCGSVFRNPPGDYAARLIEASGLKGHRIGGAVVSTKHANFIITDKQARAADIEQLIEHIIEVVKKAHRVSLLPEVRIVGERS